MRAVSVCRTPELGGHLDRCESCGFERPAYNSCRNRHCPKCQALSRARWLAREATLLLPVEYHHVVFTLPQEVAELARAEEGVAHTIDLPGYSPVLSTNISNIGGMFIILEPFEDRAGIAKKSAPEIIRRLRQKFAAFNDGRTVEHDYFVRLIC